MSDLTITEFLLARVAEREALARAASPGRWDYGSVESVAGGMIYDETRAIAGVYFEQRDDHDGRIVRHLLSDEANRNGEHIAANDPRFVLAECEAKRRIIELRYSWNLQAERNPEPPFGPILATQVTTADTIIRTLAQPYADHADFDPKWVL